MRKVHEVNALVPRMRELYAQGLNYKEVAQAVGLPYSTVHGRLTGSTGMGTGRRAVSGLVPRMRELYDRGLTQRAIALEVGVSEGTVSRRLQDYTKPPTALDDLEYLCSGARGLLDSGFTLADVQKWLRERLRGDVTLRQVEEIIVARFDQPSHRQLEVTEAAGVAWRSTDAIIDTWLNNDEFNPTTGS